MDKPNIRHFITIAIFFFLCYLILNYRDETKPSERLSETNVNLYLFPIEFKSPPINTEESDTIPETILEPVPEITPEPIPEIIPEPIVEIEEPTLLSSFDRPQNLPRWHINGNFNPPKQTLINHLSNSPHNLDGIYDLENMSYQHLLNLHDYDHQYGVLKNE